IENRDVGDDTNNHGHAHARSNVELGAGDPQTEKHSSHGEYREQQHREGNAKTFVKKEQKKKNEKNCCDQNDGETAEGDLLLFVKSAESVEHIAWNHVRSGKRTFHITDRRAEIATTDAPGHCNHPFEIVAHDFRFAADRNERGYSLEWKQVAIRRAQKEIVDVADGVASVSRDPDAHADQFWPLLNVSRHI